MPLARRTPLKSRRRPVSRLEPGRIAWKQPRYGRCENCGQPGRGPLHGHHVIARQVLARAGADEWDERNRMDLCAACHMNHEFGQANRKIAMVRVPVRAVEFAVETLGEDIAVLYLDRHYAKDAA